jgi:GNAT superfamily N-acetyltransferase
VSRGISGPAEVSRYDIRHVEIYDSARKHGIADEDIEHAIEQALVAGERDDAKVLYLGPDRAGNLLEVVTVERDDGSEIVIHAMRMRPSYEPFLRGKGEPDA